MALQHTPARADSKSMAIQLALEAARESKIPQAVFEMGQTLWEVRSWERGMHTWNTYRAIVHPDGVIDYV